MTTTTEAPTALAAAKARLLEADASVPSSTSERTADFDILQQLVEYTEAAAREHETEAELQAAAIAKLGASLDSALALRRAVRQEGLRGSMFGYELITLIGLHPIDESPLHDALGRLRTNERIDTIQMLITDTEQTDPDEWEERDGKENQLGWLRGFLRAYTLPMIAAEGTKK
jgi:hypothetical protein